MEYLNGYGHDQLSRDQINRVPWQWTNDHYVISKDKPLNEEPVAKSREQTS
ncbi:unnamed protein product [Strongylus vulgaris]|uniref:Uncharacterized protein n=1 Tax=Strongylus vulgaris TaxID=40348 RepID=A0A3P7JVU0_STRVU|nr:unnamed protein product [Strongylus vulgaris]